MMGRLLIGVNTSIHADKRAKKRASIKDPSVVFELAKQHGLHQRDMKGNLRSYIDKRARNHQSTCVIYKGNEYWYSSRSNVLKTVIPVNQKWHKYIKALENR